MQTIIDYVEHELRPFSAYPLNPVDSLVLSELSYLCIGEAFPETSSRDSRVTLRDLFVREKIPVLFDSLLSTAHPDALLAGVASSPRFRDVRVTRYVNEVEEQREKQFSAVTFLLPGGASYIAYRGTDSSLVGWKENFNMAFMAPVPAQSAACRYIEHAMADLEGPVYAGGHSKGGNLAVYAAASCGSRLQDRIACAFNHDGPGFNEELFDSPGFVRVERRLNKTVPQESLIGMLLETHEDYSVVASSGKGLLQHDPFTWEVLVEKGDFRYVEHIERGATTTNEVLNDWISSMNARQREAFVDALYRVIKSSGYERITDIPDASAQQIIRQLAGLQATDPETFVIVRDTLAALADYSLHATMPIADNLPRPLRFLLQLYTEQKMLSNVSSSLHSSKSQGPAAQKGASVQTPGQGDGRGGDVRGLVSSDAADRNAHRQVQPMPSFWEWASQFGRKDASGAGTGGQGETRERWRPPGDEHEDE